MKDTLSILFSGDFAPCRAFENPVLEKEEQVLGDALPLIQSADLAFVNLECPLTNSNDPISKDGPVLKANPECISAIGAFSVVGLANNHILDYGQDGLRSTLDACASIGLPTVGAGATITEAQKVFIKELDGVKVAVIAIAEHEFNQSECGGAGSAPIDLVDNYHQIQTAKSLADIVILTLHGGNEYLPYPRPRHRKMLQHFIDLGVDAVLCHHPHVPGAYELYKGKPIVYSLGNFLFDHGNPPKDWNFGYMAKLIFDVESKAFASIDLIPYEQSVQLGGVRLLKGDRKEELLRKVEHYREKLGNESEWLQEWDSFVRKKADGYLLKMFFPFTMRGLNFLSRYIPITRIFYNKRNSLSKLNLLRCQSHRELLIYSLESRSTSRND